MTEGACENTDQELWRERFGDFYADSIHVTKDGGIGINVSGHVIVMPLQKWHALAAEPAPESAVQSETVRRNMLNSDPFASLFGTFGRLSQRELHIMNAALTLVADQPAPEPVAKMNMPLIWLYSHCRALGMTKHSDSGELEHDIALFVADLKDAAIRKGEAP